MIHFWRIEEQTLLTCSVPSLLIGQPWHTYRRLTKANLGREAEVSHDTLHRAKTILGEWDIAVAERSVAAPEPARTREGTAELRSRLSTKTQECIELR